MLRLSLRSCTSLLVVPSFVLVACGGGSETDTAAPSGGAAGAGGTEGTGARAGTGGATGGRAGSAGTGSNAGSSGSAGGLAAGAAGSAGKGGGSLGGAAGTSAGAAGSGGLGGGAGQAGSAAGGASAGGAGASGATGGAGNAGASGGAGQSGAAGSTSCGAGAVACSGVCIDPQSDVANCGGCGKPCDATNGTPTCAAGLCVIVCQAGFADCDRDPKNGCETSGACACTPGEVKPCYGGPVGTENVGACVAGTHTCDGAGTGFGACVGAVLPQEETCLTIADEDCDGLVNESGEGCQCVPGATRPCYGGPDGTEGVGPCHAGTQTCVADGTGYGACTDQVVPVAESCLTADVDDDCDGALNESGAGCLCVPGATLPCYEAAPITQGVGACKPGVRTCQAAGTGFGPCEGQVLPAPEICDGTLTDESCDGQVNEGGAGCVCAPQEQQPCYTGPAGTQGVGVCAGGVQTCTALGTDFGACANERIPSAEVCDGSLDDEDCDGQINEDGAGCLCVPGSTAPCYEGPAGTSGVGTCRGGQKTCDETGTAYGACVGQVVPQKDFCSNAVDEDCNGSAVSCTGASQDCNPTTGDCEDACSPALLGKSYVGCEYYPTITPNLVDANTFAFAVAVANTSAKPATVTVTRGAAFTTTVTVAANSAQIIRLPWVADLKGPSSLNSPAPMPGSLRVAQGAYKLTSSRPITVYQYSPLDYAIGGQFSYTNDASLLLPVNAWTGNYRVAARHHFADLSGFFTVVASQNNTIVNLTPGPQSGQIKAGVAGVAANGAGQITLNAGDVATLVTNGGSSPSDPNDPTGMLVAADKPVQVIGGHQCTFVPDNTGYCDHLEESIFPIETLGTSYLVAAPLIAANTPKARLVRIIATAPNTTLTYDPPQAGAPTTIAAAGGWVELAASVNNYQVTGSQPILVAQYALGQDAGGNAGDPDMALAVTTSQYRPSYLFHAPTNYSSSFVSVTAPDGAVVTLDGAVVPAAAFAPIGATGYRVARLQLSNAGNGNHTVVGNKPVGISVYGYGQYTSYWYPGGLDLIVAPK